MSRGRQIDNLIGKRFNMLIVLSRTDERLGTAFLWLCKCDCGKEIKSIGCRLKSGRTKSCGHFRASVMRHNIQNLVGKRFGRLIVIEKLGKTQEDKRLWKCVCDCGGIKITITHSLLRGATKSCGCIAKEGPTNRLDISGQRFGRLVAIKRIPSVKQHSVWLCHCDCGKEKIVLQTSLQSKKTRSCSCLRKEIHAGENSIFYKHGKTGTPEFNRERHRRRNALEMGAIVETIDPRNLEFKIFSTFKGKCAYCGNKYETIDHVLPLSRGGPHCIQNLVPSCSFCNSSKKNHLLCLEWKPKILLNNIIKEQLVLIENKKFISSVASDFSNYTSNLKELLLCSEKK